MADGKKKSTKQPLQTMIGHQMAGLSERLKAHKTRKSQQAALDEMHGAVAGKSPLLKTAYWEGVKRAHMDVGKSAEDTTSFNADDTPIKDLDQEPEEEKLITMIRRGWPDQLESAKKHYKGRDREIYDDQDAPDYGDVSFRAQINHNSPETTA